jgi:hypothetical protein
MFLSWLTGFDERLVPVGRVAFVAFSGVNWSWGLITLRVAVTVSPVGSRLMLAERNGRRLTRCV